MKPLPKPPYCSSSRKQHSKQSSNESIKNVKTGFERKLKNVKIGSKMNLQETPAKNKKQFCSNKRQEPKV